MNPASTTTLVIIHPVSTSKEYLLGQDPGFPAGDQFLSAGVIRQAIANLRGRDVQPYEDGLYHADISYLGMKDLLAGLSVADAIEQDFHFQEGKPNSGKKTAVYLGVRWEIGNHYKAVKIYGPKSDPNNVLKIDLAPTTVKCESCWNQVTDMDDPNQHAVNCKLFRLQKRKEFFPEAK